MAASLNVMLQFGMVQAQVGLNKATDERKKIEFKLVHECSVGTKEDGTPSDPSLHPVNYKKVCSGCAKDLAQNEMGKAFQPTKGVFVKIEQSEIDGVKVPTNGAVIINEIVSPEAVADPTLYTGQSWFVRPMAKEKYPPMAYAVILEALRGKVALARTSMYGQEYTVAIRVGRHGLVMHTLRYPSEMREEESLHLPNVDPNYVTMAKQLMQSMTTSTPKLDYTDSYNEGLAKIVESKVAGLPLAVQAEAPTPVATVNLEATLKAMLAAQTGQPVAPVVKTPVEEPVKAEKKKKGKKVA